MKYYEAIFTISPFSSDAADLLCALAGEADFETFEETATGIKGYVQQSLFSEDTLSEAIADFPFDGVTISYAIHEADDRDWNEQWEQEGFAPIVIERDKQEETDGKCSTIIIHDGRHLPDSTLTASYSSLVTSIEIDAKLAFGTGTHETTRMICATLLDILNSETESSKLKVLDCGTGTGILSICALKLGAGEAIGYDIDEWSVDNARHNAVINQVDDRFTSLLGDASILNKVEGEFDIVLANINRNILLADLPSFRQKMAPGASLILSGFYTADSPMLIDKAQSLGLTLIAEKMDNDWACLQLSLIL